MKGLGLGTTIRASINLEMALLIALLVLVSVVGLTWMGDGIGNKYANATSLLIGGGSSGPTNGSAHDNGDGTATITWSGGTGPYLIRRNVLPIFDGTQPIVADNLPSQSYTGIVPPGDIYLSIEDSAGNRYTLPTIIHITVPAPPAADCYVYQRAVMYASFEWMLANPTTAPPGNLSTLLAMLSTTVDSNTGEPYLGAVESCPAGANNLRLVAAAPSNGDEQLLWVVCPAHPLQNSAPSVQAARFACCINQIAIEKAAQDYHLAHGIYPPAGPVDATHPLIAEGYLARALRPPLRDYYAGFGLPVPEFYPLDAGGIITGLPDYNPHY